MTAATTATSSKTTAPDKTQDTDFQPQVGDLLVHPSHGAARVAGIEERSFGDESGLVYVLTVLGSELKIMVPKSAARRVGLRPVMTPEQAQDVFEVLRCPEIAVTVQPWNRRLRAYTEMLSSGDPLEIAKILRDMGRRGVDRQLSFSERKLMEQAHSLLADELAVAQGVSTEEMNAQLQKLFAE